MVFSPRYIAHSCLLISDAILTCAYAADDGNLQVQPPLTSSHTSTSGTWHAQRGTFNGKSTWAKPVEEAALYYHVLTSAWTITFLNAEEGQTMTDFVEELFEASKRYYTCLLSVELTTCSSLNPSDSYHDR